MSLPGKTRPREPHLNGPGGEVPALFYSVDRGEPLALCGQGVAPAAATIERFRDLGHELIPGTGVLASAADYYARPPATNDNHGLGAFLLMYDQLTCR